MGTRSDYYIMKEEKVIWLGSCGWDGYPNGIPEDLVNINLEEDFRNSVFGLIEENDGYNKNWPWPWGNSRTTDFTYVFKDNNVYVTSYIDGEDVFVLMKDYLQNQEKFQDEEEGLEKFKQQINFPYPDMTKIQKVDFGKGNGVIVL